MPRVLLLSRRTALVVVAGVSVLCALVLGWVLVTPETVGRVPTPMLLTLLGLLVLPVATLGLLMIDYQVARHSQAVCFTRLKRQTKRAVADRRMHQAGSGRRSSHRRPIRASHEEHTQV